MKWAFGLAVGVWIVTKVRSHPLCYTNDRPTDLGEVLDFCPAAQAGACCTDTEENAVEARYLRLGALSAECLSYYKQVSDDPLLSHLRFCAMQASRRSDVPSCGDRVICI